MTRTVSIRVARPTATVVERSSQQINLRVRQKTAQLLRLVSVGPPAAAPEPIVRSYIAGRALSGHKAVRRLIDGRIDYASADQVAHAHAVLGLTTHAAVEDALIEVRSAGDITEASWNLTPGKPVFLGINGELTQIPPPLAVLLVVGMAATSKTVHVRIAQPILRS